jgi:multiple sugar transport system permease protein
MARPKEVGERMMRNNSLHLSNDTGIKKAVQRGKISIWVWQILLTIFGVMMLMPFFWMLSASLKIQSEIFTVPIKWVPAVPQWHNYIDAMRAAPFGLYYFNSFKIGILKVAGSMFFNSLTAYAFAKLKFRGRDKLFLLYLTTMMIPPQVTLVPSYIIMGKLGWINTHLPLIVPGFFQAYFTFMLRQFFITIPDSLIEASKIDGASQFRIFFQIIAPLAKPAYASLAIIQFIWTWNDLMGPLIYLNSSKLYTVIVGMGVFKDDYLNNYALLFAASVVAQLPLMLVYISGQRFFQQGVAMSGIKG